MKNILLMSGVVLGLSACSDPAIRIPADITKEAVKICGANDGLKYMDVWINHANPNSWYIKAYCNNGTTYATKITRSTK